MAVTDGLTGLYNYRYFHDRLRGEMARCTRYGHALSIVMVDLDNFKAINDRFGHLAGDDVLREVALRIKRNTRGSDHALANRRADVDIASRYGGEEFIIIMPEAAAAGAAIAAERLRAVIEAEVGRAVGLQDEQGGAWRVTGSFGVAAFAPGMDADGFVKRADEAVYRAKHSGKNCVMVTETQPVRPAAR
jgi:two-component system cell cycle response regulator